MHCARAIKHFSRFFHHRDIDSCGQSKPLLANKIDGDCFALVRAHQHGITIHNQDVMRERESGVILFITYYYGGGGGVGK